MDFYVVAFSDQPRPRRKIRGRWYHSVPLGPGGPTGPVHAICEKRITAPVLDDDELRHQHHVVMVLGEEQTILPVRFGAQVSRAALEGAVAPHAETLRRGLNDVRDRVQMNVRFLGKRSPLADSATPAVRSGREYLERRRASTAATLSPDAAAFLARLERLAARQRLEPGAGSLLATAYHLVQRNQVNRYLEMAGDAKRVGAVVTGPFPPFAFTPAIL